MPILTQDNQHYVILGFYAIVLMTAWRHPIALAFPFLLSGLFKVLTKQIEVFQEFDYTIVTVLFLGLAWLVNLRHPREFRIRFPVLPMVAYSAITLLLLFATDLSSPGCRQKFLQHLGFNTVAFLAPFFLFRRRDDMVFLYKLMAVLSLGMAVVSFFSPVTAGASRATFLAKSDSIALSRTISAGIILIAALWSQWKSVTRLSRWWGVIAMLVILVAMIRTGSRGPVIHMALALAFLPFASLRFTRQHMAFVVLVVMAFVAVFVLLPDNPGLERISTLRNPMEAYSIQYRTETWSYLLRSENLSIFGQGLGTLEFGHKVQAHSLMLDLLYSGGVVSLLLLAYILGYAYLKWMDLPRDDAVRRRLWVGSPAFMMAMLLIVSSTTAYETISARVLLFWTSTCLVGVDLVRAEIAKEAAARAAVPVPAPPAPPARAPGRTAAVEES